MTVDLSAASGMLEVEWFDPGSGQRVAGEQVGSGSPLALTSPFGGDAVLYLRGGE